MPFFDLIIQWIESSEFGPKSDDLGHRILESDFIRSGFVKSDCISRPILLSDRKIKIRSPESDRIIISLKATNYLWRSLSFSLGLLLLLLPGHVVHGPSSLCRTVLLCLPVLYAVQFNVPCSTLCSTMYYMYRFVPSWCAQKTQVQKQSVQMSQEV